MLKRQRTWNVWERHDDVASVTDSQKGSKQMVALNESKSDNDKHNKL